VPAPRLMSLDPTPSKDWSPPPNWFRVIAIDSHTAGEPFRLIVEGTPPIEGDTMVKRRACAMGHHDWFRKAVMWEPRGHADMYGGIIGPPADPSSDLSVLFMHNDGFSTMCGHGIIALTKIVIETGIIPVAGRETRVAIDTPAGQIRSVAVLEGDAVGEVRFRNVPSFVSELDAEVDVPGVGPIRYDLAFGGGFYAYVRAADFDLTLEPGSASRLIDLGRSIKTAVARSVEIIHPIEPELGFLYGVIFVDEPSDPAHHSRNVCVFADGEIDRSPTGTGVSGRLAIHRARGEIGIGEPITIEGIVGSTFGGVALEDVDIGGIAAVIPEVSGRAFITGRNEMWIDPDDTLGAGFLIR
jgi:proline racemase